MHGRGHAQGTRSSVRTLAAWSVATLVVTVGGPLLVIGELVSDRPLEAILSVSLLVLPVCGALVLNQQPGNTLGWLFLVSGSAQVFSATVENGRLQALGQGVGHPWLAWAADEMWPLGFPLLIAFGMLFFPEGSAPRRWRLLVPVGLVGIGAALVGTALAPWSTVDHRGLQNPLARGNASLLASAGFGLGQLLLAVTAAGGVATGFSRYRSGSPLVRSQLRLVLLTMAAALAVLATLSLIGLAVAIPDGIEEAAPLTVVVGLPVSVTVALFRHRLFDLDVLVNRAAVALTATLLLSTGYVVSIAASSWLLSSQFGWLAGCVGALTVALALRLVLQRTRAAIGARLFGDDEDLPSLLAEFSEQTERSAGVAEFIAELAEVARRSVRAPHVAVRLADGATATAGLPRQLPVEIVTITSRGVELGEMLVCARSATDRYTDHERELLAALARQAAAAIRLARSADELQRAHEWAAAEGVEARERLRRDLHDELGPRLAGVTYLLQALRSSVPAEDRALLTQAREELQGAINDVRRMSHDLRPSVLEELGLAGAIRRHAVQLSAGSQLDVVIDAIDAPGLPEKVEIALYRVALEALRNVGQHAHARTCVVRLHVDSSVASLEVSDDGRGIDANGPTGIGLLSMVQRVSELGGDCQITNESGTTVKVQVPIHV